MLYNIPCRSNPMPYYKYVDPEPLYDKLPITFEPMSQSGKIKMVMEHDTNYNTYYYKKKSMSDWALYTSNNSLPEILFSPNDPVSFSGTNTTFNTGWDNIMHTFSASVDTKVYGRLDSLTNSNPNLNQGCNFGHVFCGKYINTTYNLRIVNVRNLILPDPSSNSNFFDGFFNDNSQISAGPVFDYQGTGTGSYKYFFSNCTNLKVFELKRNVSYAWDGMSFNNVPSNTVCILPSGYSSWDSSYLTSNKFRYVYRNEQGLFYNNQKINENVLLETGVIEYV